MYDGSKPLADYLCHFWVVAPVNRWSEYEKGLYLAASLAGPAQRLLTQVDIYRPSGYEVLLDALPQRYAPRHQEELHRADLKSRWQRKEQSLRALADSIEVAVEKAYPQANPDTTNQLCLEYYLGAVRDPRVRQWVHTRGPADPRHTVSLALQCEYSTANQGRTGGAPRGMASLGRSYRGVHWDNEDVVRVWYSPSQPCGCCVLRHFYGLEKIESKPACVLHGGCHIGISLLSQVLL